MKRICKNCQHWKPLYDGCKVNGCDLYHDVISSADHCTNDFKYKEL